MVKIASWFDKSIKLVVPNWGKELKLKNENSKTILGVQYHDLESSVIGITESMLASGLIQDKRKK